jgi:hypothetical protein
MTREGGCEWYQSIGFWFLYISTDYKKKVTGPLIKKNTFLEARVRDPGSGAFWTPGSGIGFFRIPDPKPIFLRA